MSNTLNPGAPIPFNYTIWAARFPKLANVPEPQVQVAFEDAQAFLSNCAYSAVRSPVRRIRILGYLTAHLVLLRVRAGTADEPDIVGRIDSATQGSVSVNVDMGSVPFDQAWFFQTEYGATAWQMMAQYRSARYIPGPNPYLGVGPPFPVWY